MIIELIDEAVNPGARLERACCEIGIASTTINRWRRTPASEDLRRGPSTKPANALTAAEEREAIALMNAPEHSSMSPDTLVPHLATMGIYVASHATMYRILRREKLLKKRGRSRSPTHRRPREHVATRPNQVWAWDITFLPMVIRGRFLKLYVVLDVWSRLIVGAEVHEVEDDALAATLIERCCSEQGVRRGQLVLHSDNGGAMKGNTMLAAGDDDGARARLDRAIAAVADGEPVPGLQARARFARARLWHGDPQRRADAVAEAQQARAALPVGADAPLAAAIDAWLAEPGGDLQSARR